MITVMTGFLGADAKETEKGFSFSISQKNRVGNEENNIWITCFQNYKSGIFAFLKKGTLVQVIGTLNVGVYLHPEKGPVPSLNCAILNIELLPSKNKENKE